MPVLSKVQSHLRFPLTGILGSAGNVRVLRALVADKQPQSAPRIAELAGLTPQGARLVLDTLGRRQLVTSHGSGRTQLYALNSAHAFAGALTALFRQEQRRWDAVVQALREVMVKHGLAVRAAWLYGSVARGEDSATSDLDIAVLVRSRAVADRLREDLMPLEEEQQLHISLTALTQKELAALAEDDPWWSDVVRDGRVLKGPAPRQARQRFSKAVS